MSEILSMSRIKTKAWQTFAAKRPISECPYPVDSAAYKAWRFEYQRLEKEFGEDPDLFFRKHKWRTEAVPTVA